MNISKNTVSIKIKFSLACITVLFVAALAGRAASIYDDKASWDAAVQAAGLRPTSPPFVFYTPADAYASNPNALIIGDSISIGYTAEARSLIYQLMNVYRVPANAQNTTFTLENIDTWIKPPKGKTWAVIYCNWGLHDLTSKGPDLDGYEKNLRILIDKLRATGAKVVFATTTPIPQEGSAGRKPGAELPYNAKALDVMRQKGVLVSDLYNFVKPILNITQRPSDVHYSSLGYSMLAQPVARAILAAQRGSPHDTYLQPK